MGLGQNKDTKMQTLEVTLKSKRTAKRKGHDLCSISDNSVVAINLRAQWSSFQKL